MARFKVEIFKRLSNERWENRYHIETLSFTTAADIVPDIIEAERTFHSDQVLFEYARVSTIAEGDDLFQNTTINQFGIVPGSTTGGLLPLWNVAKVYFNKDLQRPDFKLYRGVIGELNSDSGQLGSDLRTLIRTSLNPLVTGDPQIVFPVSGAGYVSITVDNFIRQRDLHRRRRRTQTGQLVTPE